MLGIMIIGVGVDAATGAIICCDDGRQAHYRIPHLFQSVRVSVLVMAAEAEAECTYLDM